jgi:hypothetical protein
MSGPPAEAMVTITNKRVKNSSLDNRDSICQEFGKGSADNSYDINFQMIIWTNQDGSVHCGCVGDPRSMVFVIVSGSLFSRVQWNSLCGIVSISWPHSQVGLSAAPIL